MFQNLFKPKRASGMLGVGFYPDGLAFCRVGAADAEEVHLEAARFASSHDESEQFSLLEEWVHEIATQGMSVQLVLSRRDYQLLQVEAPDVPEEEMADAVRWKVQELIDFPVEQAVMDYFRLPSSTQGGSRDMLNVAVADAERLRPRVDLLEHLHLNIAGINIPELALRNVCSRFPEDEHGVMMLYLQGEESMSLVTADRHMYLARSVDASPQQSAPASMNEYDQAHTMDFDGAGFNESVHSQWEHLVLEVQRSLDYYESYFGRPPASGIVMPPVDEHYPGLYNELLQQLTVPSRILDVGGFLHSPDVVDDHTQTRCLPAIGAALCQKGEGD